MHEFLVGQVFQGEHERQHEVAWLTITTDSASDLRFRDVSRLCTRFSATSAMDSPAGGRQYSGSVFLNIQLRA